MKKNVPMPALFILIICVLMGCHHRGRHGLDVNVSESGSTYRLQAWYNRNKTGEVVRYINRQIQPSSLFSSADDYFDVHTQLSDRTRFYIKSSPGRIIISINKRENSPGSYEKIKRMCGGVVEIVKGN